MNTSPRVTLVAALAACLSLTTLACNQDEPATYRPEAGEWTFEETTVVSNSCDANLVPDPLTSISLDYDGGDSFQIELGDEDVACEIDGVDFTCGAYSVSSGIPGIDAVITWSITWEGEFLSETEAEGNETTRVTCAGEDCNLAENLPCSVEVTFEAMAVI